LIYLEDLKLRLGLGKNARACWELGTVQTLERPSLF